MTEASPQMRFLARQLHEFERSVGASAGVDKANPFPTLERFRLNLALLMGPVGCRALIARAIKLASAEVPWLATLATGEDGELKNLPETVTTLGATAISDGEVALLSQLIGLLVAFIGPALALRLIKQLWPQLAFGLADFSADTTHEKD